MKLSLREASPKDITALVRLCADHAAYEKAAYAKENKEELLRKHIFSYPEQLKCIVVVDDADSAVGYAFLTKDFSIWNARFYTHMDCLYLDEPYRGGGIGRRIMDAIQTIAKQWECNQIQWQTPIFNEKGINFYRKLDNFEEKEKIRFFWQVEN